MVKSKCSECENKTYHLKIENELLVLKHNNEVLTKENEQLKFEIEEYKRLEIAK
jgi:hypothetical protein